jgi:hypothetical protein
MNITDLSAVYNKILNYFINLTNSLDEEAANRSAETIANMNEFKETHLFYIALILMRRTCSSIENSEQLVYFKYLFATCSNTHKSKMKQLKNFIEVDKSKKFQINSFHIDFIRTSIYYSTALNSKHSDMKIKGVKLCKNLIDLLFNMDDKIEFDVNYFSKLITNSVEQESQIYSINNLKSTLIKSIALSLNTFGTEDLNTIFEYFEKLIAFSSTHRVRRLILLTEFMSFASSEIELNDSLKTGFSEYIQKV